MSVSHPVPLTEGSVNLIAEGTRLEGKLNFEKISRVHGILIGEVHSNVGSTLILGETCVVEGNIHADTLIVDGFVRGDIDAQTRVVISGTGRVLGNIRTPSLNVEFGAWFEGRSSMEDLLQRPVHA